ncbi:MAG: VOC family protein [Clostridiales bacterium]|nr:VOC family protein [Clostridiales bacterium]
MKFIPYIMLEGNTNEALEFYKTVFKGEISSMMRFDENPEMSVDDDYKNKILHAELKIGKHFLYFSDAFPGQPVRKGDQVSTLIEFDTIEEIERVYKELSEDVEIFMPIADTFWNSRFASFVDKYGIGWSLNYQYPEK